MKILVIDDERLFPSLEGDGVEVHYARTSMDAYRHLLAHERWNAVMFDHDLGEDGDALEVVDWMRSLTGRIKLDWSERIGRAYVHSMNPVGAQNLVNRLTDLGIPTQRVPLPDGHTVIPR